MDTHVPIHPMAQAGFESLSPSERERERSAPLTRLAIYGSLAPGCANHHVLDPIQPQSWHTGTIRARIIPNAAYGQFPGATMDPTAHPATVRLLESPALRDHWDRLDAFEGPQYQRTIVPVTLQTSAETTPHAPPRIIAACIYTLAGDPP